VAEAHYYLKPDDYQEWLQAKASSAPQSVVHVWADHQVIGRMELGTYRHDQSVGYVHLYYLVPSMRGKGRSAQLDKYACDYLRGVGHSKARLSVTKTNERARSFYQKMGWLEIEEGLICS
jgi:GNAT superfamily N-acetyltransferase